MHAPSTAGLPTGTVTFLFTDIEGSTRLLTALGAGYPSLLEGHARVIRGALAEHGGIEVSTEGDAFFAVFPSAVEAVAASAQAQRGMVELASARDVEIRVRMGLHSGEGQLGGDNYVGMDVHRAARIAAAGHGGQVLLSESTRALIAADAPDGLGLRELGPHRLKDLPEPEPIWQLEIAGLPNDFPPLRSLDTRPNNLPLELSPLIGRTRELDAVVELLASRRLVTLVGPGGVGKTRLAVAVAERLLGDHADGVFFVGLDEATDRAAVVSAIASALTVRERPNAELESILAGFLGSRELLLVLDNFEQVVSAAPLVARLLEAAPRLRVLVTSRTVLNVSGEQTFEVLPLALPDPGQELSSEALSQYDAVALFVERAVAARPGFAVTNANAPAVAEICSRLDGLPLAIELAAARVRLLTPEAILARLHDRLPALGQGRRDAPARQRTLRQAVDWSYELLDDPVRRLFVRLAAFTDGCPLDAADEVCNPDAELGIDILEGLAALADSSLIRAAEDEAGPRFRMLQVIREAALDRLEHEVDGAEIRRRQALWVARLVEEAEPELIRTEIRRWQLRLRREEENIRTALRWAIASGETLIGWRIAGALWHYWHYWARQREGRELLEAVLALPAPTGSDAVRAKALSSLAAIVYWQGDGPRAAELYEEALAIHRQLGDDALVGETLWNTAWAAVASNDVPGAMDRAGQALAAYERAGDEAGVANVTAWIRSAPFIMGASTNSEEALAALDNAIAVNRRLGRMHDAADTLGSRAMVLRIADHPDALAASRESLRVWSEIGNLGYMGFFKQLAALELKQGEAARAARIAAAGARLVEQMGGELPESMLRAGDPLEESRARLSPGAFEEATEAGRRMTVDEAVAYALEPGND